jgi:tetratricopeptide (TPR) repeat protein
VRLPIAIPLRLAAPLLLGAALALYWSGLRSPLLFDDGHLQEWALRTRYADAMLRFASRWVSDTSFSLVYAAFGYNLVAQRVVNILAHAAVAAVLFAFTARLGELVLREPRARWLALAGALLFLLHPTAVYAVGYLIQRSIVLATLFSIVSLICVLEALVAESRRRAALWYAGAAGAYVLAVFSKEHAVMLPGVAIALAVLVRGISWRLARRLTIAALPLAAVGLWMVVRSRGILGAAYEPFAADVLATRRTNLDPALIYPLSALNQAALFFRYVGTWLFPWPGWMAIDVRVPFPRGLADPGYVAALAAWLAWPALAAWLLLKRARAGIVGFAMLVPWFLGLTEMAVVRVQEPFVLYRSYLWMGLPVALLPLAAAGVPRRILAGMVIVAAVAFVPLARDRLDSLSTTMKAWEDALAKHPAEYVPYIERAYVGRGLAYIDERRMAEAAADFAHALALNPYLPEAYLARATVMLRTGRFREAEADLDQAVSLEPRYGAAYHKRCLIKLGENRLAEALQDCEKAETLMVMNHELHINLGVVYRQLGRRAEAEKNYRRALEIAPRHPSAHYNYAVLLLDAGRLDEAREHFEVACKAKIATACVLLQRR